MAKQLKRYRLLVIQPLGDDSNKLSEILARAIRHAKTSRSNASAMMIVDAKSDTTNALNFAGTWNEELQKAVVHIGRGISFLSFPQQIEKPNGKAMGLDKVPQSDSHAARKR